jgi:deoxyribonuclease IV
VAPKTSAAQDGRMWHPYLGAHMSIAGGVHKALEEAARHRSGAVQLFTKNNNQWSGKPLTPEAIEQFVETDRRLGPFEKAAHDSYLINLASPDPELRAKSLAAFIDEVERCEGLGIPRLVFHPGAHVGEGEAAGIERVASAVREAIDATPGYTTRLLFENTAGQGSSLGHRLEHLSQLIDRVGVPERTAVCLDTCHLFAAGYDLRTPESYAVTRRAISRTVGLKSVGWWHLNDAKRELGSRVDRHAHIGKGKIGSGGFRNVLTDTAFRRVPMVLETPKEDDGDKRNLALLRRLSRM